MEAPLFETPLKRNKGKERIFRKRNILIYICNTFNNIERVTGIGTFRNIAHYKYLQITNIYKCYSIS